MNDYADFLFKGQKNPFRDMIRLASDEGETIVDLDPLPHLDAASKALQIKVAEAMAAGEIVAGEKLAALVGDLNILRRTFKKIEGDRL